MDELLRLLNQPFFYGVASTLLLVLGGWILSGGPRRVLRLELRKKEEEIRARERQLESLRDQLHTQMEINNKGNESLKKERDQLAERVKYLDINVATLQQKPGRAERRQLAVYQLAIERMFAEAPGFAPAWQSAVGKAEAEVGQHEQGFGGFLKGIVTKALPGHVVEEDEEDSGDSRRGKDARRERERGERTKEEASPDGDS